MPKASNALLLSLLVPALLAACDDKQTAQHPPQPAPEVTAVTLAAERLPLFTELPGRTTAFRVAEVRPQVSGIILKRLFEEGAEVKAGQQLYQIDPATYQATVESARATLARDKATLRSAEAKAARYADLVKIDAVSRQDYDDAAATADQSRAAIQVDEASLHTAQINLEYTRVLAPISGRIGKSAVTEGALVTADQTTAMATITQLDPIFVDINQSSSQLLELKKALAAGSLKRDQNRQAPVTITTDGAQAPYDQPGKLQFSEVTVDASTGAVQIRALFPNPRHDLYPGLFVHAKVEEGVRENALLVPQRALVRNPDGSAFVWLIGEGNKVAPAQVAVSQPVGDRWLVESGLKPGDRVVTEGLQKIKPGVEVRLADAGTPAAPSQH